MSFSFELQKTPVDLSQQQEQHVVERALRILREETLGNINRIIAPDQLFISKTPVIERRFFRDNDRLETTSVLLAIERAVFEIVWYWADYRFPTLKKEVMNRISEEVMGTINNLSIPRELKHQLPPRLLAYISTHIIRQEDKAQLYLASMRRLSANFMSSDDSKKQIDILKKIEARAKERERLLRDNFYLGESIEFHTNIRHNRGSSHDTLGIPKHVDMQHSQAETSLIRFVPRYIQKDDALLPDRFSWHEQDQEIPEDIHEPTALRGRMLYTLLQRKVFIYMFASIGALSIPDEEKRKSDPDNLLRLHKEIEDISAEVDDIDKAVNTFIDPGSEICDYLEDAINQLRNEYQELLSLYFVGNNAQKSNIRTQIQEIEKLLSMYYLELTLSLEAYEYESRLVESSQMIRQENSNAPDIHTHIHNPGFLTDLVTELSISESSAEKGLRNLCIPNEKHNIYTRFLAQKQIWWLDKVDIWSEIEESHIDHLKNVENAVLWVYTRKLSLYFFAYEYAKKNPEQARKIHKLLEGLWREIKSLWWYANMISSRVEWLEMETIDTDEINTQLREEYDFLCREHVRLLEVFMRSSEPERISLGSSLLHVKEALNQRSDELYDRGIDVTHHPKDDTYSAENLSVSEQIIIEQLEDAVFDREVYFLAKKIPKVENESMSTTVLNHARERKLFLFFEWARMIHALQNSSTVTHEKNKIKIQEVSSYMRNIVREIIKIEVILRRENPHLETKHRTPTPLSISLNRCIAELDWIMALLPYFGTFTEDERLDTERRLVGLYKALSEKLTTLSGAVLTEIETGIHQQIHTLLTDLSDFLEVIELKARDIGEELSDILDQYPARALNLASFTIRVQEEIGVHIQK